ncbi:hypothetical protein POTOM_011642 [Populus tomentosa]|uniref:Uncharacterized protein n=1 Tax=Populus tomentosa TaxID=118781 RepID=A0A8X8A3F1_POPTO|nr:hypothetical protein POTOM_011642 [Populus tomentosa]
MVTPSLSYPQCTTTTLPSDDDMKYIKTKVANQNWHSLKGKRGVLEKGYCCEVMGGRKVECLMVLFGSRN